MKIVALIAGLVFLGIGVAGFAAVIAMSQMHAAVFAVSGVAFLLFGIARRRAMVPQSPSSDHDLRPWV
jgi:arginine exporter protein ArgO